MQSHRISPPHLIYCASKIEQRARSYGSSKTKVGDDLGSEYITFWPCLRSLFKFLWPERLQCIHTWQHADSCNANRRKTKRLVCSAESLCPVMYLHIRLFLPGSDPQLIILALFNIWKCLLCSTSTTTSYRDESRGRVDSSEALNERAIK